MRMNDFLEGYVFRPIKAGDIVKGKVVKVLEDGVVADIGYKGEAFVPKEELSLNPEFDVLSNFHEGEELDLYIVMVENEEGSVVASKIKAEEKLGEEKIEKAYKNREIVKGEVVKVVKGGVIAYSLGKRLFIPASHLSTKRVENLEEYLGKILELLIIEYVPGKKIIASRKEVIKLEEEKMKAELLERLEEGDVIEGKVSRIIPKGAFVNLEGMDGFIPISELGYGRIKSPEEVIKPGDKVSAYVLKVDKKEGKITLSLKKLLPNPWENVKEKYHEGDILKAKITRIMPFGVFAELEPGVEGLVHKNNLEKSIKSYSPEDIITVEVLEVSSDRISLKEVPPFEREDDIKQTEYQELTINLGEILKKKF
ncbi:S1 RNA-binding domain-containing protein [Caldanaerobacter subterraneus]|uniref:S1 RNA-binding domain-containing protein n=2 Tax=Caldanaerobacter subterraneus TaxID=911092 RepID=A0A7Y2PM41_9THEO|nr:S1 RNA-binding domain-containing protein [Caldanaerobacter subterraneus]